MDMHSCTDAGTHSNQAWDKMKGECNIQTELHRDTHVCMKLCKEDGADNRELGVICIHVLMHVHSLIKVLDHKRGGLDTHGGNRVIHICVQLSNVCGADVGSRVDMHIFTYICTYSTPSVGPERRYLAYACGATQGHPSLHVTNRSKQFCMQLYKGVDQMWEARWACINVLMHVHILISHSVGKKEIIFC